MTDPDTPNHILIGIEIAARLEEMEEQKTMSSLDFVRGLVRLGEESPVAYRMAVQFMHGCSDRYLSYAHQAALKGVSKQAIHKEFRVNIERIRRVFPAVASQIEAMRAMQHAGYGNGNSLPPHATKESFLQ